MLTSEWLTVKEVALELRISVRSTWALISAGRIRTIHPTPGRTLVTRRELDAFKAAVETRKVA